MLHRFGAWMVLFQAEWCHADFGLLLQMLVLCLPSRWQRFLPPAPCSAKAPITITENSLLLQIVVLPPAPWLALMPVVTFELLEASALPGCCLGSWPRVRPSTSCNCALGFCDHLLPAATS